MSRTQTRRATKIPIHLVASVSRSSGLEKDGDALKNFKTQQEYRDYIETKIQSYWKLYTERESSNPEPAKEKQQRISAQENLLILFRKLREGIVASKRRDAFGLEAYHTALELAIIFESPRQASSIISQLPSLHESVSGVPNASFTVPTILSLLFHLVAHFPSQSVYAQHLSSLPISYVPKTSPVYLWLKSLTSSLRRETYAQIDSLTKASAVQALDSGLSKSAERAFNTLLKSLREKSRAKTWEVMRSAYRELATQQDTQAETRGWLSRSLCLEDGVQLDDWIEGRRVEGGLKPKEGAPGRFMVSKQNTLK